MVSISFASGTLSLNSSNWDLTWQSVVYRGAYGLGAISQTKDSPGEVQGITFTVDGGDSAKLSLALDAADQVQLAPVIIRTGLIETSGYTLVDAPIEWVGVCDTMQIVEVGSRCEVTVKAESKAVVLLRGNPSILNDADQQYAFAGDRAFEYVVQQTDKPVVWPSREYFYK
jgi:hypothetical protein